MSSKPQLICITGADGTGKSTLVHALAEKFPQAYVANIWDLLEEHHDLLFRSKRDIDQYLCALTPDARLLFLAHALKYSADKALRSGATTIFFNAYYYKYFATELALGASASLVKNLEAEFPRPHKVVRLLLDPKAAASRKQHFSRYECGAVAIPSAETFIRFQQQAAVAWKTFDTSGWKEVDASLSPELVLAHTLTFIGA